MTIEERKQKILVGIQQLQDLFGFDLIPTVQSKQLGDAILIEPAIRLAPRANWLPPNTTQQTSDEDSSSES